jgi:hypothetical protein
VGEAEHDREELRRYIAERDIPCPGCGYNLRGLASNRCPECNRLLRLTVAAVDAGIGPLIAAALGLGSSGAAGAALLAVVACLVITEKDWPRGDEFTVLVFAPLVIALASTIAVLALASRPVRGRFLRQGRPAQVWIAIACWGLSAAAFGCWFLLLRRLM